MNDVMIECFKAATKTLNFTIAAQQIHISQPSFSRNISMLEEEVGFPLFWRSKQNGLRLTPAGLVLYNKIVDLEAEYKETLHKAKQISRGEDGKIVIGVLHGISLDSKSFYHIDQFQKRYPHVVVEFKCCTLREMENSLINGSVDICFIMADIINNHEQILHEQVFSVQSFLVVPRRLHVDKSVKHSLIDFKDECFILSEDFPGFNIGLIKGCRALGFEPKIQMAPDFETRMLWVNMGKGVAGCTKDHYIVNSPYVDFIQVEEIGPMKFSLAWNKENYNPSIALFYSLIDEISEIDYEEITQMNEE